MARNKKGKKWNNKKRNVDTRDVRAKSMQLGHPDFDTYYKAQGIVGEHEWDAFSATLLTPLPTAFRMNQHSPLTPALVKDLQDRFPSLFEAAHAALQADREALAAGAEAAKAAAAAAAAAAPEGEKDAAAAAVMSTQGTGKASSPEEYASNPNVVVSVLEDDGMVRLKRTLPARVDAPTSLPWVPHHAAWNVSLARRDLRRLPQLKAFHEWLKLFTETGDILRQEAVSMIPPLLLDVQPHHIVLDMCAAPGSKTAQLLEALHAQHVKGGPAPTGIVMANDTNPQRAYMMSHRLRPLQSASLAVTCNDGRSVPNVFHIKGAGSMQPIVEPWVHPGPEGPPAGNAVAAAAEALVKARQEMEELSAAIEAGAPRPVRSGPSARMRHGMFDRILCDAPCSGDGTLRKTAEAWKNWTPRNGIVLAPLQLAIARRGVAILKVGGLMVYSTCTFNPIEDEAIVAQLLREFRGNLELVDTSAALPGLKRRPGISTWTVFDSAMKVYPTYDAARAAGAQAASVRRARNALKTAKRARYESSVDAGEGDDAGSPTPEAQAAVEAAEASLAEAQAGGDGSVAAGRLAPYMWPPTAEEAGWMNLQHCLRLLPHDSDTGGFFVALLRKTGAVSATQPEKAPSAAKGDDGSEGATEVSSTPRTEAEDDGTPDGGEEDKDADLTAGGAAAPTAATGDSGPSTAAGAGAGEAGPPAAGATMGGSKRPRNSEVNKKGIDTTKVAYEPLAAEEYEVLRRTYGLSATFPAHRLYVRTFSDRVVHYMSEAAAAMLSLPGTCTRLKLVNVGVPMFDTKLNRGKKSAEEAKARAEEAAEASGQPPAQVGGVGVAAESTPGDALLDDSAPAGGVRRVCTEGIRYITQYMTRRVIAVGNSTFAHLLRVGRGKFLSLSSLPTNFAAALEGMGTGAVVVVCDPLAAAKSPMPPVEVASDAEQREVTEADADVVSSTSHGLDTSNLNTALSTVVWRNPSTANVLVRKEDREAFLLRMIMEKRVAPTEEEKARYLLEEGEQGGAAAE